MGAPNLLKFVKSVRQIVFLLAELGFSRIASKLPGPFAGNGVHKTSSFHVKPNINTWCQFAAREQYTGFIYSKVDKLMFKLMFYNLWWFGCRRRREKPTWRPFGSKKQAAFLVSHKECLIQIFVEPTLVDYRKFMFHITMYCAWEIDQFWVFNEHFISFVKKVRETYTNGRETAIHGMVLFDNPRVQYMENF